jgi:hypothetical protein
MNYFSLANICLCGAAAVAAAVLLYIIDTECPTGIDLRECHLCHCVVVVTVVV